MNTESLRYRRWKVEVVVWIFYLVPFSACFDFQKIISAVRGIPVFEPIQISRLSAETADKTKLFINTRWVFWCYLFTRS